MRNHTFTMREDQAELLHGIVLAATDAKERELQSAINNADAPSAKKHERVLCHLEALEQAFNMERHRLQAVSNPSPVRTLHTVLIPNIANSGGSQCKD